MAKPIRLPGYIVDAIESAQRRSCGELMFGRETDEMKIKSLLKHREDVAADMAIILKAINGDEDAREYLKRMQGVW